jgi:hypothetical protein
MARATPRSYEQPLAALFTISALAYLTIYALEAPIRFGLLWAGKDQFILARDFLIFGPLGALLVAQGLRLRLHPAFLVAGILIAFHGLVFMGTIRSVIGLLYGVKIVINILFGFFAASALLYPSNRALKYISLIWGVLIFGVFLDKFGVAFPWAGMKTIVGDINVDVSKDWMISDPFARRVAGFARSSIAVACVVPPLAIIMINRMRHTFLRLLIALLSLAAVFFTTQKGAIIAFAPLMAIMFLPSNMRLKALRIACISFIILAIAAPLLTLDVHLSHGSGVFSTESLYLRIAYTWPQAIAWIERHDLMLFGVGLGGIGGPQRFYAPDSFNPADNVMILLYAYFGIFAALYVAFAARLATRPIIGDRAHVVPAIAILAFCFGYGTVLSMIEDQSAALFIGAALGVLWRHTGKVPVTYPTWRTSPALGPRRAFTPAG